MKFPSYLLILLLLPLNSYAQEKLSYSTKGEISQSIGIRKKITFHSARHTFATVVTLSNGVPIETVSKLLGHTKLSTTQIYARVLENKLSKDISNLDQIIINKRKGNIN